MTDQKSDVILNNETTQNDAKQSLETGGMFANLAGFVPITLMMLVFYFLVIRPANKKQAEHDAMVDNVKVGTRVVTSSGIFGVIRKINDSGTIFLEIAPNTEIEVFKKSIHDIVDLKILKAEENKKKSKKG